jgi:hypothetical protein
MGTAIIEKTDKGTSITCIRNRSYPDDTESVVKLKNKFYYCKFDEHLFKSLKKDQPIEIHPIEAIHKTLKYEKWALVFVCSISAWNPLKNEIKP